MMINGEEVPWIDDVRTDADISRDEQAREHAAWQQEEDYLTWQDEQRAQNYPLADAYESN